MNGPRLDITLDASRLPAPVSQDPGEMAEFARIAFEAIDSYALTALNQQVQVLGQDLLQKGHQLEEARLRSFIQMKSSTMGAGGGIGGFAAAPVLQGYIREEDQVREDLGQLQTQLSAVKKDRLLLYTHAINGALKSEGYEAVSPDYRVPKSIPTDVIVAVALTYEGLGESETASLFYREAGERSFLTEEGLAYELAAIRTAAWDHPWLKTLDRQELAKRVDEAKESSLYPILKMNHLLADLQLVKAEKKGDLSSDAFWEAEQNFLDVAAARIDSLAPNQNDNVERVSWLKGILSVATDRAAVALYLQREKGRQTLDSEMAKLRDLAVAMAFPAVVPDEDGNFVPASQEAASQEIYQLLSQVFIETYFTANLQSGRAVTAVKQFRTEIVSAFPQAKNLASYERALCERIPELSRGDGHFKTHFDEQQLTAALRAYMAIPPSMMEELGLPTLSSVGGVLVGVGAGIFVGLVSWNPVEGAMSTAELGAMGGLFGAVVGGMTGYLMNRVNQYKQNAQEIQESYASGQASISTLDALQQTDALATGALFTAVESVMIGQALAEGTSRAALAILDGMAERFLPDEMASALAHELVAQGAYGTVDSAVMGAPTYLAAAEGGEAMANGADVVSAQLRTPGRWRRFTGNAYFSHTMAATALTDYFLINKDGDFEPTWEKRRFDHAWGFLAAALATARYAEWAGLRTNRALAERFPELQARWSAQFRHRPLEEAFLPVLLFPGVDTGMAVATGINMGLMMGTTGNWELDDVDWNRIYWGGFFVMMITFPVQAETMRWLRGNGNFVARSVRPDGTTIERWTVPARLLSGSVVGGYCAGLNALTSEFQGVDARNASTLRGIHAFFFNSTIGPYVWDRWGLRSVPGMAWGRVLGTGLQILETPFANYWVGQGLFLRSIEKMLDQELRGEPVDSDALLKKFDSGLRQLNIYNVLEGNPIVAHYDGEVSAMDDWYQGLSTDQKRLLDKHLAQWNEGVSKVEADMRRTIIVIDAVADQDFQSSGDCAGNPAEILDLGGSEEFTERLLDGAFDLCACPQN